LDEVKKLRQSGITAWELDKAKNYLTGSFARGLQAPENLTAQISNVVFYGLPENYLQEYVPKLRAVTLDDVKNAVNKYFHYDDLLILTITNVGETKTQMDGLGMIEEVPAEKAVE
jgi:zinc protease